MARYERIVNHVATTLNGAINDTVTSITVNNAASWPAEGDYRLRVGSEVVQVTSRAANVLTVVRGVDGTTAASHSDADTIEPVITATGLETYFNHAVGYTSRTRDSRLRDIDGNTLTAADWSFDNQASSFLENNPDGTISLISEETDTSGATLNVVYKAAPTPPYTVTACFQVGPGMKWGSNATTAGLLVRENSTGEFINVACNLSATWGVNKWNSPTSFSAAVSGSLAPEAHSPFFWMQIEDDNTDLFWRGSYDGLNFFELGTEGRTAFMAGGPDQVGFQIAERAMGTTLPHGPRHEVNIRSWEEV